MRTGRERERESGRNGKKWMRSEGIVLEIRAYRNGNSFWPTFRSSRPRCVCIAAPCLFSRRIVNETRINCENFNPEKKSTTVHPPLLSTEICSAVPIKIRE